MRVARQSEVFVFGERRKLGRSGQSCCCQEVTAQARARTMPTARIACDVNAAEEMELERLEGSGSEALHGGSPVSSGAASDGKDGKSPHFQDFFADYERGKQDEYSTFVLKSFVGDNTKPPGDITNPALSPTLV